jgi:hypothetical protein
MTIKAQEILNPHSDWNQAANDEPVFVLRAINWKAALIVVALCNDNPSWTKEQLLQVALDMKRYSNENDIPF